jgi:TetR/AcrR family transcriptional regulator, cholesterol catabolism regulator
MKPDRKTEIVTIAARLFREKGYSAVTMRDLAQAMDIKAASLYNHIKSKQEILSLMILSIAEEYTGTIRQISTSDDSSVEKLEQVIQLHIDITAKNADALASLNNDWMHLPQDNLGRFLQMREEYEAIFRSIVRQGISEGEIAAHDPEVLIFSMLSTLRTLYLWYGKKHGFSKVALQQNLKNVLIRGILQNHPTSVK